MNFRDQIHCAPEESESTSGGGGTPLPEKKLEPVEKKLEQVLEPVKPPATKSELMMSESTAHALLDELRIFNGTKKEKLALVPTIEEKKEPEKKAEPPKKKRMGWFDF